MASCGRLPETASQFYGSATVQQDGDSTSVEFNWNAKDAQGPVLEEIWKDAGLLSTSEVDVDETGLHLDVDLGTSLDSVAFTQMVRSVTNIESGTILFFFCNIDEVGPYRIHRDLDSPGTAHTDVRPPGLSDVSPRLLQIFGKDFGRGEEERSGGTLATGGSAVCRYTRRRPNPVATAATINGNRTNP